jgi:4-hydroxy-2-oxoheptanedioate aldolase
VQGAFHDDLNAAIERIRSAAVKHGKRAGIYCVGGEAAKKYAEQGFHMVCSINLFPLQHMKADYELQISVVADAVALPTYLSNALETAKGAKSGAAVPTY